MYQNLSSLYLLKLIAVVFLSNLITILKCDAAQKKQYIADT